jgi:hypothetical protein
MNAVIERINAWAGPALSWAGGMLWQSSLLIALLCVLEWRLGKRLRPSLRYALWLAVLLKLVLPPSLALPSGIAWWARSPSKTAPPVHVAPMLLTYGPAPAPMRFEPASVPDRSSPELSAGGIAMAGSAAGSLVLFVFLFCRWRQVARRVTCSANLKTPRWLIGSPEWPPGTGANSRANEPRHFYQ